jgi:hypothetical protein
MCIEPAKNDGWNRGVDVKIRRNEKVWVFSVIKFSLRTAANCAVCNANVTHTHVLLPTLPFWWALPPLSAAPFLFFATVS